MTWPTGSMERTNYTPDDVEFWRRAVVDLQGRHDDEVIGDTFDCGFQYGICVGNKAARWKASSRPTIDDIEKALS